MLKPRHGQQFGSILEYLTMPFREQSMKNHCSHPRNRKIFNKTQIKKKFSRFIVRNYFIVIFHCVLTTSNVLKVLFDLTGDCFDSSFTHAYAHTHQIYSVAVYVMSATPI